MSAEAIQQRLAAKRINVSVSRVGSSRLDFEKRGLQEVVRASVHYYNLEKEVQALLDALKEL
jgi:cysteine desulfurase/selenocysteine lyase